MSAHGKDYVKKMYVVEYSYINRPGGYEEVRVSEIKSVFNDDPLFCLGCAIESLPEGCQEPVKGEALDSDGYVYEYNTMTVYINKDREEFDELVDYLTTVSA